MGLRRPAAQKKLPAKNARGLNKRKCQNGFAEAVPSRALPGGMRIFPRARLQISKNPSSGRNPDGTGSASHVTRLLQLGYNSVKIR
jgi:hypothetical protein